MAEGAELLPTEAMVHVAVPKEDTLEDHVAVKKLFCRVMVMAVEAVVRPVG
jgi:hypothetical protein